MKKYLKILFLLIFVLSTFTLVGCFATETGKPGDIPRVESGPQDEPGDGSGEPGATDPDQEDVCSFTSDEYGIYILCPEGWGMEEVNVASVLFFDKEDSETKVVMAIQKLSAAPESLLSYLHSQDSEAIYAPFNTGRIEGYVHEISSSSLIKKNYYFLKGDTLISFICQASNSTEDESAVALISSMIFN